MDENEIPTDPREAVSLLMDQYGLWAVRFAYFHLKDRHLAEDIVQEAFLRVFNRWSTYRKESSIKTWLGKIVINLCRDHFRRHGREIWYTSIDDSSLEMEDKNPTPEEMFLHKDLGQTIRLVFDELNEQEKAVILMFYYFDLSTVEIAQMIHASESTIRSRLMRARQKLKKAIEKEGEGL